MRSLSKLRILVVEDDVISQEVTRELLNSNYHCEIDIVSTATEALEIVNDRAFEWEKKGYDAILMDIYLPDINGDLLTEVIRKTETHTQSMPIIAVSGKASANDKKIFQEMGVTDLLLKPLTMEDLERVFQKYLKEIDRYRK